MVTRAIVLAHRLVLEGGSELSSATIALLRRTLESLAAAGVEDVCVVDGEHAAELCAALTVPELVGLRIDVRSNTTWRQASGSALLVARDFLTASDEPCLVVRGDRPLEREALSDLVGSPLGAYRASLCVSTAAAAEAQGEGDLSDEVKVRLRRSKGGARATEVVALGLDLDHFDAVFTGHAVVLPSIVEELESLSNPALEDGLLALVRAGRVRAQLGRVDWPWGFAQPVEVEGKVAAILETKQHPRYTLLNPGPVNTTARVKSALVHHDVCHRDPSFSELMVSLTGKLRRVFRGTPQHTVCVLTGSGTAAMECAIASTVPRDRKILVIDNGAFGERMLEIARVHEMDVVHLRYAWGDQVEPADVERAFAIHPDIAVVAMVAHETSVGLLNPLREVGELCRRFDALFLVDAVSALGAEDLDVVRDNIDVCWSSANKCLHAISGAGFLCVSPRTWQRIDTLKPRSYYLDLRRYRKYVEELAQTPFTPAVSAYFALDAACSEFLADGHARRFSTYRERNQRLRQGLADLGAAPLTRTGRESHSVVTACVPEGVSFDDLYKGLKARGFIVYGCKDVLADKFFQVANMGDLPMSRIEDFLATCAEVVAELRAAAAPGVELPAASPAPLRATA